MSMYGHMSISIVLTFPQKMSLLSRKFFDHKQTIRYKCALQCFMGAVVFSWGFQGQEAQLNHLHKCTTRTAFSQKGEIRMGNPVAERNQDGKSKLPLSAATFSVPF